MTTAPGVKHDDGKPRCALVLCGFARALLEVSKVGTFGAAKYSDNGWVQVRDGIERYSSALLRHLLAESINQRDEDTGLLHAAHVAWNALARLDLMLRQQECVKPLNERIAAAQHLSEDGLA